MYFKSSHHSSKMAAVEHRVIPNNCVAEIKIPRRVRSAYGVDHNPALGLYATFNCDEGVSVWNPMSGKVVAEFRGLGENFCDTLFVPGDRIAVSSSEVHHGGVVEVFNLDKDRCDSAESVKKDEEEDDDEDAEGLDEDEDAAKSAELVIEDKYLTMTYPGAIALSPRKNLLIADAFSSGEGVSEIFIDWDNLKVLKSREIIPGDDEAETGITLLCCSPDFKVATFSCEPPIISTAKVCMNSEEEVQIQEQENITYFMLNGQENQIDEGIVGLVHDGENLIVANYDESKIVLLESMTEGSNAHLVASDVKPTGQMRISREGQLVVCEEEVLKLFEYRCNPRPLQDLCRFHVRKTICTGYKDKINSLEIPSVLKNFLLFN